MRRSRDEAASGVEENKAVLTLDERGMILDCDRAGEALFKYRRNDLVCRHVSMLLPQLAELELMANGQPNPRLRFLCRIGCNLQTVTHDGERFASELFLTALDGNGHSRLLLIVCPAGESVSDCGQCESEDRNAAEQR